MKRATALIIMLALLLCGGVAYAAAGGGAGDPLVSVSYILEKFVPDLMSQTEGKANDGLNKLYGPAEKRLDALEPPAATGYNYAGQYKSLTFEAGGTVKLSQFASFMPVTGVFTAKVDKGTLIDISTGSELPSGTVLTAGHRYFAAEESAVTVTAYAAASGLVDGYYIHAYSGDLPADLVFVDIGNHWAKNQIIYMAGKGYVNGVGDYRFAPDDKVTRAMFVTVLGRVAGVNASAYTQTTFTDVKMSMWYGPYVSWASSLGLVTGYDSSRFAPDEYITREQMALILVRFINSQGYRVTPVNEPVVFTDSASIHGWAADAVSYAQVCGFINGIAEGNGYAFKPLDSASRGQMCAVMERLMSAAGLK